MIAEYIFTCLIIFVCFLCAIFSAVAGIIFAAMLGSDAEKKMNDIFENEINDQ